MDWKERLFLWEEHWMSNQYLSFDVTKQSAPQQLIIGRQGDSQLKFVTMLFWDGDKNIPYNLVNKQVAFEALKPDDTHIVDYDGVTILDAEAGLVRYSFNEQVFAVDGQIQQAFFKITHTDSDNNVIADSTLEVNITVLKNRVEFGINSKDYLSEYNKLVADVKKLFDNFADTVKDSIEKAQALHDQIVEYTNLINSNGVITKGDFGNITDIKQPIGGTVVEKINNELYQRGINVKWFGAVGDGQTDDTAAIQGAISYARQIAINSLLQDNPMVVFPSGNYKITDTIVLSPFAHIYANGLVNITSYADNKSAVWITSQDGDPKFKPDYSAQEYSKAPLISGGEFRVKWHGNFSRGKEVGVEIGSRTDLTADYPTARYEIQNLAIDSFYVGMKWNRFNHYLGSFTNCHFEPNTIALLIGDEGTIADDKNSGENFSFNHCVFGEGSTGIMMNVGGFQINMIACSIDFIDTQFKFNRGYTKINYIGGHLEHMHKIAVSTQTDQSLAQLNMRDTTVNTVKDYVLYTGTFLLVNDNVKYERSFPMLGTIYLCDWQVTAREIFGSSQSNYMLLSPRLNVLSNPKMEPDSNNNTKNYNLDYKGLTDNGVLSSNIPVDQDAASAGDHVVYKPRKFTVTSLADDTFLHFKTKTMPCTPGDMIRFATKLYTDDAKMDVSAVIKYVDLDGTVLNPNDVEYFRSQITTGKWSLLYGKPRFVPNGAVSFYYEFAAYKFSGNNNILLIDENALTIS